MEVKSESEVAQSCPTLLDPMDCTLQASPSVGFSSQEYWSGVPSPSLEDDYIIDDYIIELILVEESLN